MRVDHEHIEELIAAQALGGLEPAEADSLARERAEHGADCPECRRLESDYGEVAGRLAFALDPVPLPEGAEDRLMAAALGPATERAEERPSRGRGLIAAVAAVLLLAVGGLGGYLLASGPDAEADLAAFLAQPDTRVVHFTGTEAGSLAVAYQPGRARSFLVGSGLPDAPGGRTYQLWLIEEGQPVSGGTFEPEDGSLIALLPANPSGSELMAITIEPRGGSPGPTSDIIYQAPIQA
jgi:anti-sigma-K factor RskA